MHKKRSFLACQKSERLLSILAGIIGSDGHLDKDQPVIRIINKNKEFLEEIAKLILKKFTGKKIRLSNSISGFGKKRYLIIVYDRILWKVMNEKYGIPAGNKSTKIRLPENLSSKAQMNFLLGCARKASLFGMPETPFPCRLQAMEA